MAYLPGKRSIVLPAEDQLMNSRHTLSLPARVLAVATAILSAVLAPSIEAATVSGGASAAAGKLIIPGARNGKATVKDGSKVNLTLRLSRRNVYGVLLVDGKVQRIVRTAGAQRSLTATHTLKVKKGAYALDFVVGTRNQICSGMGLGLTSLGSEILVTNRALASFTGVAHSRIGIASVRWKNVTNGKTGTARGKDGWTAPVTLREGDNQVAFTAMAPALGCTLTVRSTVTYDPDLDVTTPLNLSNNVVYVNEARPITFTLGVPASQLTDVQLHRTDCKGNLVEPVGAMLDDGNSPDEIQSDGLFTSTTTVSGSAPGSQCFRAQISRQDGSSFLSEQVALFVAQRLTEPQLLASTEIGNGVVGDFEAGKTALQILAALKSNPDVAVAGANDDGKGVWWVTKAGILGLGHEFQAQSGQKAGGPGATAPPRDAAMPSRRPAARTYPVKHYADRQLEHLRRNVAFRALAAAADDKDRVGSTRGLLISPFINHPGAGSANNFGKTDDYFGPWQKLVTKGSVCSMDDTKVAVNNGSIGVGLDDFKNLDTFGLIHFSTHGDNYYNGILSLWQDAWGPDNAFWAWGSVTGIYSGILLPTKADGAVDITGYEDYLVSKQIALSGAWVFLLPEFFRQNVGSLPNSVVFLSACKSMFNDSLSSVLLGKGAGTVFGFTQYVSSVYAQNTTGQVYEAMLDSKTAGDGFKSALARFGASDKSVPPAFFRMAGSEKLRFGNGSLSNGGFEDGVLAPWSRDGDGRVVERLGQTMPTEGGAMGIVSTGLGNTTVSGQVSQDFCTSAAATTLEFDWNFFSEEFVEFCNSRYQDSFDVDLCELDEAGKEKACHPALSTYVDALCGSVQASDVSFDRGGVYNTGWRAASVAIQGGKSYRIKFRAGDVGDSAYDTAVLIDRVRVTP